VTPTPPSPYWWRRALCREVGGLETFFGDDDNNKTGYIWEAKKICEACPVIVECGRAAFPEEAGLNKLYGVRAGLGPMARVALYGHLCPLCGGQRDSKFRRICDSCRGDDDE
jgi:hypothetical protein